MKWFRGFRRARPEREIDAVKNSLDDSLARLHQSTRRLSQAAENARRRRQEDELARSIARYRRAEGL